VDRLASSGLIEAGAKGLHQEEKLNFRGRKEEFCFEKNANSPCMGKILEQILHCRFIGAARQFFIEGKALELIALKLDMVSGTPVPAEGINDDQMQGLLAARDLLFKDIQNPPSIHKLARAAGMSHPRLGKCFKSVFGCSPFELLRKKRLEWSLDLVRANEMSLTEIAYAAGYANSGHFSKAFLDYYGIQPSRYRKKKAGNPFYSLPGPQS
jgi:AraC-like DNA-binding protein